MQDTKRAALIFALTLVLSPPRPSFSSECIALESQQLVVSSPIALQAFAGGLPAQSAEVTLYHPRGSSAPVVASGKTDAEGYAQITDVLPGLYTLSVRQLVASPLQGARPYEVSVGVPIRVVTSLAFPSSLIAMSLGGGMGCGVYCRIPVDAGPRSTVPRCLVEKDSRERF